MKYGGRDPMPLELWGLHASSLLQGEALLHFQSVIRSRPRESIHWDEFVDILTTAYHTSGKVLQSPGFSSHIPSYLESRTATAPYRSAAPVCAAK